MKLKLPVIVILFLSFYNVNAQVSKGSLWLGGYINYGSSSSETRELANSRSSSNGLTIAPFIGKSITDNSIAGISLFYRNYHQRSAGQGYKRDDNDYGGGVFYRKYKALGKGFYVFGNGQVSYTHGKILQTSVSVPHDFTKSRIHTIALGVYPGVSYAINRNIHLELRTGDLLNFSFSDEDRQSQMPGNNIYKEHLRNVQVSTSLNNVFSYWGMGFRFLLNGG